MSNDDGGCEEAGWTGRDVPGRLVVISGPSGSRQEHARPAPAGATRPAADRLGLGDHPGPAARRGAGPRLPLPHARASSRSDPRRLARVGRGPRPSLRHAGRPGLPGDGAGALRRPGDRRPGGLPGPPRRSPTPCSCSSRYPASRSSKHRLRARGTDDAGDHRPAAGRRPPRAGTGLAGMTSRSSMTTWTAPSSNSPPSCPRTVVERSHDR